MTSVIVITGAGRSGTSLCTQALAASGMRLSPRLVPPSEQNPAGIFEDQDILDAHKKLMACLFYRGVVPDPTPWGSVEAVREPRQKLEKILAERTSGDGVWGFKDPRITNLIPIWVPLFNAAKIVPVYFFCARVPIAVRESLERQYGMDKELAEFLWLFRTVWFLKHIGSRAFILHYEDWFSNPKRLAQRMTRYAGLAYTESAGNEIKRIVQASLNRSSTTGRLGMEASEAVASALDGCRGDRFDSAGLNKVVDEVYRDLTRYPLYFRMIYDLIRGGSVNKKNIDLLSPLLQRVDSLEVRVGRLEKRKPPDTRVRSRLRSPVLKAD